LGFLREVSRFPRDEIDRKFHLLPFFLGILFGNYPNLVALVLVKDGNPLVYVDYNDIGKMAKI